MNRIKCVGLTIAVALGMNCTNSSMVEAQSVPGASSGSSGGLAGTSTNSATGINSATTQSPTATFQLQNSSAVNSGTLAQPLTQPGLVQNHAPVIKPNTFGVATGSTDFSRQAITPNQMSTPNPVMPQQVNRAVLTPGSNTVPTYQKSKALQQMQPQLFKSP